VIELLTDPSAWVTFVTLSALEIVLGIDNLIFLSILVGRLPPERREVARITGLALAMITRIALLFSIVWLTKLVKPWFYIGDFGVSGRDLILGIGGLFLLAKSTLEIHHTLEGVEEKRETRVFANFTVIVVQIAIIDIVFSLDSVFTAVGLAKHIEIMVAAIVVAVGVMMFLAAPINEFIEQHPTIKILALAFLILVGVALTGEAFEMHIPKGYLYFAMAFSFGVEMINIRIRERGRPVKLRDPDMPGGRHH
jgi:predicted tellurium resistance membrane protein TerC